MQQPLLIVVCIAADEVFLSTNGSRSMSDDDDDDDDDEDDDDVQDHCASIKMLIERSHDASYKKMMCLKSKKHGNTFLKCVVAMDRMFS